MEKTKEIKAYLSLQKKLVLLKYVSGFKSITKALREFRIPKSTFYKWKKAFDADGEIGLLRKHPIAYTHPNKIKEEIVDKVLALRKEHQLGSWRIKWYLEHYHDINISESSVTRILKRYGVERLQKKAARRSVTDSLKVCILGYQCNTARYGADRCCSSPAIDQCRPGGFPVPYTVFFRKVIA